MNALPAYIDLIEKAQLGDKAAFNALAEATRDRLRLYVYRLTLDEELAQEIVQETLIEMFKILGKLKETDKFWPWLYGIATNKLHRHYRTERKHRNLAAAQAVRSERAADRAEGFENLVAGELRQIITGAMDRLKTRHKAVLVMRCYDEMSYADIAQAMNSTEFGVRMLFVRAKKSLQRELLRNGFGRKTLIPALILFGKMTAPSEAAAAQVSVTAATASAGLAAGLIGAATTKTAVVSTAAAGLLVAGSVAVLSGPDDAVEKPAEPAGVVSVIDSIMPTDSAQRSWYYFPQGPGGPVMIRTGEDLSTSRYLQDDHANYIHRDGAIYMTNHRYYHPDLSVMRLPTDSADLAAFLSRMDGRSSPFEPVTAGGKGLLVVATRGRNGDDGRTWAVRHTNVLDEDFFQSDWPANLRTIDDRDAMHRRGWAGFAVTGRINGEFVSGQGRIPFTYAASRVYSPYLDLWAGNLRIVDTGSVSGFSINDEPAAAGAGGAFFAGLARPWMGLHVLDSVRRDAAACNLGFVTERIDDTGQARVTVSLPDAELIYTIDLANDLIHRIELHRAGAVTARLVFFYDSRTPDAVPSVPSGSAVRFQPTTLWLAQWMSGSLAGDLKTQ